MSSIEGIDGMPSGIGEAIDPVSGMGVAGGAPEVEETSLAGSVGSLSCFLIS
jgi:hypothetical protein